MDKVKILFWLYRSKINKNGEAPLYLRISVKGHKKLEIATGYFIKVNDWDISKKQVKGKSDKSTLVNNYIALTTAKVLKFEGELNVSGAVILPALIKQHLLGISVEKKTLLGLFDYHNDKIKTQVGKSYALGTHKSYEVTKRKVISFLKHDFHVNDFQLSNLSHKFLTDFEFYLKNVDGLCSNTAMKKITHLKTVINFAFVNEWINKNPFSSFKTTYKNPQREVLTKEELSTLIYKDFGVERLNYVRDIFVFCCYTGLRYSDVEKLSPANIVVGIDGKKWLSIDTKKTNVRCRIPLFDQAIKLINKYKNNPACLNKGVVFPVKSNQKMNAYLKEIADLTGISKNLHFHLSRHTFATTLMLDNGYTLESVGKMLGQKSIRTTQIYGKMTDLRLSNEMTLNRNKIENFAS